MALFRKRVQHDQPQTGAREKQLEEAREKAPPAHGSVDWYCDTILPAANPIWSMITDTCTNIMAGTATPREIKRAMETPQDSDVARYTQGGSCGRDMLALTCLNHGINPETGDVDNTCAMLILDAICDGATDAEALARAALAAHDGVPAVMLQNEMFAGCLARARAMRSSIVER